MERTLTFEVCDRPAFRAAYAEALTSSGYTSEGQAELLAAFDRGDPNPMTGVDPDSAALWEIICHHVDTEVAWGVSPG